MAVADARTAQKWSPEWETDYVLVKYFRDEDASPQTKLHRFKVFVNRCRGVPKLTFERVHGKTKLGVDGKYTHSIQRVYGRTNHIRFELDQGMAVIRQIKLW